MITAGRIMVSMSILVLFFVGVYPVDSAGGWMEWGR